MNCSVVVTVLNDELGLVQLLASFEKQSKRPDEIIIVDGGSSKDVIQRSQERFRTDSKIRILSPGKLNISQGRNFGIEAAKHDIIAVTDCGCTLDPDWLQNILLPFADEEVGVVSGWYLPDNHSEFEEVLSSITYLTLRNMPDEQFVPSSRSFAFRKSVWEQVGGYPEELYTAEDTVLFQKIKKSGIKCQVARDAILYWQPRENLQKAFRQFFLYARGDGNAFIFFPRYLIRTLIYLPWVVLLGVSPVMGSLWVVLILIYYARYIKRTSLLKLSWWKKISLAVPIILVIDMGQIAGYSCGVVDRMTGKVKKGRVF